MYIAKDGNGKRIRASDANKESTYFCPVCGNPVILKTGLVNTEHFAHVSDGRCEDEWSYDMSEWHRRMQEFFPIEKREVVIRQGGKTHRADVCIGNIVIEMQHSPISAEEFEDRNRFFKSSGYRLVWIFDVRDRVASDSIQRLNDDTTTKFRWSHPMRIFSSLDKPLTDYDRFHAIYLHLHDNEEGTTEIRRVVWTRGHADGSVDLSRFAVSEEAIAMEELENVEEFFLPLETKRRERVESSIKALKEEAHIKGFRYSKKYIGEKGKPQNAYICDRRKKFELTLVGEAGCRYCKYCAMIVAKRRSGVYNKYAVYCCYPYAYREPDKDAHPGYECCGATELEL